jgi:hypothetical protein
MKEKSDGLRAPAGASFYNTKAEFDFRNQNPERVWDQVTVTTQGVI